MNTILAFPSEHQTPPEGDYRVIDFDSPLPGWEDRTEIVPHYDNLVTLTEYLRHNLRPGLCVPLTEEAVLPCGIMNDYWTGRGISLETVRLCTSRYHQRSALAGKDYQVPWMMIPWSSFVVKAPVTTSSNGVTIVSTKLNPKLVQRLDDVGITGRRIAEKFISGTHIEASGVVGENSRCTFFNLMEQFWSDETIQRYSPTTLPLQVKEISEEIVKMFYMRNCGFCIEFIHDGEKYYPIDIHCRIGEDGKDYYAKLCNGTNPLQVLLDNLI